MKHSFLKEITLNRVKFIVICFIPLIGALFFDWDRNHIVLFIFFEYSLFTLIIFFQMVAIFFFTKDIRFITVLVFLFMCIAVCMVSFAPAVLIAVLSFPIKLIAGTDRSLWTEFINTQTIFLIITIIGYSANFIRRFVIKKWHIMMKEGEYSGMIEQIINMVLPFGISFAAHIILTPISALIAKDEGHIMEVHTLISLITYVIVRLIFELRSDKKFSHYYEDI
jgi:hypothetical protein